MIRAATGEVSVAAGASFDRETESAITIGVTATSQDGSSSTQSFAIAVTDVDEFDVTPISDTNAAANSRHRERGRSAPPSASPPSPPTGCHHSGRDLLLADDAGGRFAIDAATGVVTVAAGAFDRETGAPRRSPSGATSADGSIATQSFAIAVTDVDEFDVTAPADTDAAANSIAENAAARARRSASPPSPPMAMPPPMA